LKDTFLQLIDINEGKKKVVRLKADSVFLNKLERTTMLSDSEIAQKSRDSISLIGARVGDCLRLLGGAKLAEEDHLRAPLKTTHYLLLLPSSS
jgi:hypothetical protein